VTVVPVGGSGAYRQIIGLTHHGPVGTIPAMSERAARSCATASIGLCLSGGAARSGPRAAEAHEPRQVRKEATLRGRFRVPRVHLGRAAPPDKPPGRRARAPLGRFTAGGLAERAGSSINPTCVRFGGNGRQCRTSNAINRQAGG